MEDQNVVCELKKEDHPPKDINSGHAFHTQAPKRTRNVDLFASLDATFGSKSNEEEPVPNEFGDFNSFGDFPHDDNFEVGDGEGTDNMFASTPEKTKDGFEGLGDSGGGGGGSKSDNASI
jgi:hypothetical protein